MKTKHRNHSRPLTIATVAVFACCLVGSLSACSVNKAVQAGMTDSQVTTGVEAKLAADPRFDAYTLAVKTDKGRVHLSGLVGTMDDRARAEQIARSSRGVDGIDNYIRFDPSIIDSSSQ